MFSMSAYPQNITCTSCNHTQNRETQTSRSNICYFSAVTSFLLDFFFFYQLNNPPKKSRYKSCRPKVAVHEAMNWFSTTSYRSVMLCGSKSYVYRALAEELHSTGVVQIEWNYNVLDNVKNPLLNDIDEPISNKQVPPVKCTTKKQESRLIDPSVAAEYAPDLAWAFNASFKSKHRNREWERTWFKTQHMVTNTPWTHASWGDWFRKERYLTKKQSTIKTPWTQELYNDRVFFPNEFSIKFNESTKRPLLQL